MRDRRNLSDQDLDRLLAGRAPLGGGPVDEELAAFVRDVRTAFAAAPSGETERLHLAAAMEASRLNADKGNPAVRPASKAHGPDRQASGLPKWRRRTVVSSLFASLTAKIAGVAIAATATAGGLAAAGALPAPAQQAISQAASTVGINLPSPHHSTGKPSGDASPAPTSTANDGVTSTLAGDEPSVSSTASDAPNHGACVSYAASMASSLGMTGSLKGQFISAIAKDPSALSAKVGPDGKPDAACQAAIDKAKAAATAPGNSGDAHGKPDVTTTASADTGKNSGGDSHPTSTAHPSSTSNPGRSDDSAGSGSTSHPGKP